MTAALTISKEHLWQDHKDIDCHLFRNPNRGITPVLMLLWTLHILVCSKSWQEYWCVLFKYVYPIGHFVFAYFWQIVGILCETLGISIRCNERHVTQGDRTCGPSRGTRTGHGGCHLACRLYPTNEIFCQQNCIERKLTFSIWVKENRNRRCCVWPEHRNIPRLWECEN